jgi:hypothetical protein
MAALILSAASACRLQIVLFSDATTFDLAMHLLADFTCRDEGATCELMVNATNGSNLILLCI